MNDFPDIDPTGNYFLLHVEWERVRESYQLFREPAKHLKGQRYGILVGVGDLSWAREVS